MSRYVDSKGNVIKATDKAYKVLYKHRGFRPYTEEPPIQPSDKTTKDIEDIDNLVAEEPIKEPTEEDMEATKEVSEIKPIDSYVKADIIKILNEKGIKHNPGARKDVLYNLLVAGE